MSGLWPEYSSFNAKARILLERYKDDEQLWDFIFTALHTHAGSNKNYEQNQLLLQGVRMKTHVWRGELTGKLFMTRCPQCEQENHAFAVASGICAWCGYQAKESDVKKEENSDDNH